MIVCCSSIDAESSHISEIGEIFHSYLPTSSTHESAGFGTELQFSSKYTVASAHVSSHSPFVVLRAVNVDALLAQSRHSLARGNDRDRLVQIIVHLEYVEISTEEDGCPVIIGEVRNLNICERPGATCVMTTPFQAASIS